MAPAVSTESRDRHLFGRGPKRILDLEGAASAARSKQVKIGIWIAEA